MDRFQLHRFMFYNNIIQALGLIILFLNRSNLNMYNIGVLAVIFGLVDGICLPATNSVIPKLIEKTDLLKANSLIQGLEQLTGIIGAAIGGLVIAKFGINNGILTGVGIYTVAAIAFSIVFRINLVSTLKKLSWLQDFKEGFREVRQNAVVRTTLIFSLTSNIFVHGCLTVGLLLLFRTSLKSFHIV